MMDPERWRRARALFDSLADLPESAWEPFLAEACSDDAEVRGEVIALLRADTATTARTGLADHAPHIVASLAERIAAEEDAQSMREQAGRLVGPYRLVREIGRGGMGTVWLAERADGAFEQNVAIKLIRSGWDADDVHARFRAERQILAGLQHSNIAHLIDGGVTPDAKPWLALEYVDGEDLRAWCDQRRLGIAERLRIFLTVCDAVGHAHQRLVVHRDLKPSNILVGHDGVVKLLDFGIAKLLDAPADGTSATRLFTPEYAAPEQVRGEVVTTSVDIHALGLLLYELLSGRRPYLVENSTPAAYERAVLDQVPTRPSLAAGHTQDADNGDAIAARRHLTGARLRRELRGDLDAIVLKALRKEPVQRYASVADLGADIERYLQRRPVLARRGNWRYASARFVRRHRWILAALTVTLLALAVGLGAALWQRNEARLQRDRALAESTKSRLVLDFMTELFEMSDPDTARGAKLTVEEMLRNGSGRMRSALVGQPAARAEMIAAVGHAYSGLGLYAKALPLLEEAVRLADEIGDRDLGLKVRLRHATVLNRNARFREAIAVLRPLRREAAGEREADLEQAQLALELAHSEQALGDYAAAGIDYELALRAQRRWLGDSHRLTQKSAMAQVSLLVLSDRGDAAEALARQTLVNVRASSGPDDPHLADALGTLGMVLSNRDDKLAEAEALRREQWDLAKRVFGDSHPHSVGVANDFASVLFARKHYAEAADIFRIVLAQRRTQFGDDNPAVATVANNLGWCELSLGHPDPAYAAASEALRIRKTAYGERHQAVAQSLRLLGAAELERNQVKPALEHLRSAVEVFDATLGPDNRIVLGSLNDLVRARILDASVSDCAAAERASTLGGYPERSASAAYQRLLLGACLEAKGDHARAAPLLSEATRNAIHGDAQLTHKIEPVLAAVARRKP